MMGTKVSRIDGVRLSLRLVTPQDAKYIYGLRIDPRYNAHLSSTTGTIEDQRAWIERYNRREASGVEYYYLIERRSDGVSCGSVRIYDIGKSQCTWGSWILDANKPPKAALESVFLSFSVAFDHLGIVVIDLDVRKKNSRALNFYRRFGMEQVREDESNFYFKYPRDRFEADRSTHLAAIQIESGHD